MGFDETMQKSQKTIYDSDGENSDDHTPPNALSAGGVLHSCVATCRGMWYQESPSGPVLSRVEEYALPPRQVASTDYRHIGAHMCSLLETYVFGQSLGLGNFCQCWHAYFLSLVRLSLAMVLFGSPTERFVFFDKGLHLADASSLSLKCDG